MAGEEVTIGGAAWRGDLQRVARAQGLVIIGCESGSFNSADLAAVRNVLIGYRLSTLCVDTPGPGAAVAVDGDGLARWSERLAEALEWLCMHAAQDGHVGLLGEGIPAAAALRLAAEQPDQVAAIVACSGRTDLARDTLPRVRAATLLLVGAVDADTLVANREALAQLRGKRRLEVIPGASRHFVEPGSLDTIAHLAGTWLRDHLAPTP